MEGFISFNGTVSTAKDATVPALDRGFLFGDSVFETFVAFHGQVLNQTEHLLRLRRSADEYHIPVPWTDEQLSFEVGALLDLLKVPKAAVRVVVTRGNGLGVRPPKNTEPNRTIFAIPAAVEPAKFQETGLALKRKGHPYTLRGSHAKTSNYLASILALEQVAPEGFDDVLWSNSELELTECTTSNIFFIGRDGDSVEVATPPAASGILLGITRSTITNLLNRAHIPVTERIIYMDEIPRFDEAFVCSTVRGLLPIATIDQHRFHSARPQAIYRQFEHLYLTWAQAELGYRVEWNTGRKVLSE